MSAEGIRDLMHFFSIEEENLLKNCMNLRDDFLLIFNLDILYMKCLELKPLDKKELKIPAFLYLNVHREFYLAMTYFLRLHMSKSFCSLRAALDSVFTAYYLLKNPDKIELYKSRVIEKENVEWDKFFRNIKATIKKNIREFSEAEGLPEIHEFCSVHSHSDPLSILQRYNEDKEKLMLEAKYFDYEDNPRDYKKWLGCLLFAFFRIFLIFWNQLFKQNAGDKLSEIENRVTQYEKRLNVFRTVYPLRSGSDS